jgi:hypothetical protein
MKIFLPLTFAYRHFPFFLVLFLLLAVKSYSQVSAVVDYGKSFINVSKGNTGGTTEPGDTLQIRATFVVKSGTAYKVSFTDTVPANTSYLANTLRVLTNEGKTYQQWTDAMDGDPANITGTAITINMGSGATNAVGGSIANTNKPSFYGGACIMVASYMVVVNTVPLGTSINLGGGSFSYNQNSTATTSTVINFPLVNAVIYKNYGMCSNTVGVNAILTESGGTFGSGTIKDRAASSSVPDSYTYAVFNSTTGMPNDYYYGISNNTSGGTTPATGYSILNTWAYPDNSSPSHRIFSVWDIIGDHTGAANPLTGNPATDDNSGKSGGYMVVINSSYRTDTAFLDTVTNLCPNTYYQYSAWFRNICSKCGCDSNGNGASSAGYIPTAAGDSSGVHPNLTFNVNGSDYYTTGNMLYTGQWIQKGFTYLTGPAQNSMIIHIRNNAPGGGGNDWAIDDISVASCLPNISLTPNKPDTLCDGADDTVRFSISSYFNNYTEWVLQKSNDGGVTWSSPGNDTTGAAATGTGSPVYDSTTNQYVYLVTRYYQLPYLDSLTNYQITVASTVANLSNSNCSLTGATQKLVYGVNCLSVLPTNIILFKGMLVNGFANLQWVTTNESGNIRYSVERSEDQVNFVPIGLIPGKAGEGLGASYYFTDWEAVGPATYYRINLIGNNYNKYSQVILLGNSAINFGIKNLTNPFSDGLSFDLTMPADAVASFNLIDMYGRVVNRVQENVTQGLNNIRLYNLGGLANGTYNLEVQAGDNRTNKLVIKLIK